MKTEIIYEDKQLLVVYKPAGIASETARVGQQDVVSELCNYLAKDGSKKPAPPKLVHRLDQPVEGLLVLAKDVASARKLNCQLQQGSLNKQYYAVVCGQPEASEGELVDYLVKKEGRAQIVEPSMGAASDAASDAKRAVLQYQVLDTVSVEATDGITEKVSLVDIHIETGRFHQIRVQMAHMGHPLLGDQKYGTDHSGAVSLLLQVRNVALCAYQLELIHPENGRKLTFRVRPKGTIFAKFAEDVLNRNEIVSY